jgi:glycosyltransferase involved in cell wall biosynthesis
MGERMHLATEQVRVIPNGVAHTDFSVAANAPATPTIGYLARMAANKGLGTVIDAFILLKKRGHVPQARLIVAGAMTAHDEHYVESLKQKLNSAGCHGDVEFRPNIDREAKAAFLQQVTLLSVPATYGEAFGLYIVEAWACGVPVVQPNCAAFPELIESTGAGRLFEPANTQALVNEWEKLLSNPAEARALGLKGRAAVEGDYSLTRMAERFVSATRESIDALPAKI